jgi:hypothetical protein
MGKRVALARLGVVSLFLKFHTLRHKPLLFSEFCKWEWRVAATLHLGHKP